MSEISTQAKGFGLLAKFFVVSFLATALTANAYEPDLPPGGGGSSGPDPDTFEYTEWHKKIEANQRLTVFGSDLLGDRIDPHLGSLSFSQTDVSIPGNSALEVAINRTRSGGLAYKYNVEVEFGDWELSTPRIQTISIDGSWSGNRCSADFDVTLPDGPVSNDTFTNTKYSNGVMVRVGGNSQQLLENPTGSQWPSGASHVTTQNWYFTCLNNITGGGQGFIGHAPNGDKYRFDKYFRRNHYSLTGKYNDAIRYQNIIAATQVTDVHGNTVNYNYDYLNRLTSITSSDQRTISLGYTGNSQLIRSVTANGRTWTYNYGAGNFVEDPMIEVVKYPHTKVLRSVHLPDHGPNGTSGWQYDIDGMTAGPGPGFYCRQYNQTLTVTHPHGTVGTFKVSEIQHRQYTIKREPRRFCPGEYRNGDIVDTGGQQTFVPASNPTMGVTEKRLSGTGFDDIVWSYQYEQDRSEPPAFNNQPAWEDRTNWTKVTGPDGQEMTYTHYWLGAAQDGWPGDDPDLGGKLQRLEIRKNGTLLKKTEPEYFIETPIGDTFARPNPTPSNTHIPTYETKSVIWQDGDTYTSEKTYNSNQSSSSYSFGLPIETRSYSSRWNSVNAMGSDIDYVHNKSKWILGLPETVYEVGKNGARRERSSYVYNSDGQKTSQTRYGQHWANFTYHANGRLRSITDALGRKTEALSWKRGAPQTVHSAVGTPDQITTRQYMDDNGWVTRSDDANSNVTLYSHDNMGRITLVNPPGSWANTSIDYSFSSAGAVQTITKGQGKTTITYDSMFRPILERKQALDTGWSSYVNTKYDGLNRITFKSQPSFSSVETKGTDTTYDGLGRIYDIRENVAPFAKIRHRYYNGHRHRIYDPSGAFTQYYSYGYGGPGNKDYSHIYRYSDGVYRQKTVLYKNNWGQMTRLRQFGTHDVPNVDKSQYFYYDSNQRLCRHYVPEHGATRYAYDAAGQMIEYAKGQSNSYCGSVPANAAKVTQSYDNLGRPTLTNFTDATTPDIRKTYDKNGNVLTVNRGSGNAAINWTYTYNSADLLTSEKLDIDGRNYDSSYVYNSSGYMTRKVHPGNRVINYTPDGLGHMTTVKNGSQTLASGTSFHADGSLHQLQYGNGQYFSQILNDRLMPERLLSYKGAQKAIDQTFSYDSRGFVTSIVDGAVSSNSRTYSYDGLGYLKTANGPWGSGSYKYDSLGNLREKKLGARTVTLNYDESRNRLRQSVDTGHSGTRTVAYDARGNVTTLGNLTFKYDMSDQPTTVTGSADGSTSANTTYRYDGNMKRVKSTINDGSGPKEIYNVYDSSNSLMLVDKKQEGELTDYIQGPMGTLARITTVLNTQTGTYGADDITYLHQDHLGSAQAGTNAAGVVAWREQYTPFGEELQSPSANDNLAGFTGHIKDKATGLNYMQARYYDPVIGRFLSVDPVTFTETGAPGQFNRYAYTWNNPTNANDPDGEFVNFVAKFAADVVLEVAIQVATGQDIDLGAAAKGAALGVLDPTKTARKAAKLAGALNDVRKAKKAEKAQKANVGAACPICFTAGTLVDTEAGPRPIEDIKVGDKVWAWDEDTGVIALKSVTHTVPFHERIIWDVVFEDLDGGQDTIETTDEHPWWIIGKGWVETKDLSAGMIAKTRDGRGLKILSSTNMSRIEGTYNLSVADFETYFVGEHRVLVHNCDNPQNVANSPRLKKQLSTESANSAFTETGELSQGAIDGSREIIPSSKLGNPDIPDGFSKHSTSTHQSPNGDFQVHFYKNNDTGEILYDKDYKVKFNR